VDAAGLVAKRGYTNIMVFRDGLPAWTKAGYPINSPKPLKRSNVPTIEPGQLNKSFDDYLVVDIRPRSAYKNGYLPESRAMPLAYLSKLSTELPKKGKLVVVDHKGKQCKTAAQWLKNNGFSNVRWLKGGLAGYAKAGYELEKY
jgi:rhodanese-related sulfurtransferase